MNQGKMKVSDPKSNHQSGKDWFVLRKCNNFLGEAGSVLVWPKATLDSNARMNYWRRWLTHKAKEEGKRSRKSGIHAHGLPPEGFKKIIYTNLYLFSQ